MATKPKIEKCKPGDFVKVKWADHTAHGGWRNVEENFEAINCTSYGVVLLASNEDKLVLGGHFTNTGKVTDSFVILRVCILSLEVWRKQAQEVDWR